MREQALEFCNKVKAKEVENFRATSLETLRHMVAAGIGLTLLPKLAFQQNDGIRYIPFSGKKPSRSLHMIWRKTTHKSQLFSDIAGIIRKQMTVV